MSFIRFYVLLPRIALTKVTRLWYNIERVYYIFVAKAFFCVTTAIQTRKKFMGNENVNRQTANKKSSEKGISLGELFYVMKKNWIVELAIVLVITLAGVAYAKFFTKNYYVAKSDVIIKADIGGSKQEYNNTTLAERYMATISDMFTSDGTLSRVKVKGFDIKASDITVTTNEETLKMTVSCKGADKKVAKERLVTVINVVKEACEEKDDKGKNILFNADVTIVRYDGYDGEPTVKSVSNKSKIAVIGGVVSIVIAFLYALFMYLVIDKVSTAESVENVSGVRNLMAISRKKYQGTGKKAPMQNISVELDLRKLSDTFIYMNDGSNKVYQVQSTLSGEGKTSVTSNLAIALGGSQRKTLIIDCDFLKPSVHKIFKLHRDLGITDYFKGEKTFDEIVKHTGKENVDLITCGDRIVNHTIFFTSNKFKALLEEARKKYDFIFLDAAPVKVTSDYINISPLVDATLVVVGCDRISSRELASTFKELRSCDANVIGTVLNFCSVEKKRRYYYYYNAYTDQGATDGDGNQGK